MLTGAPETLIKKSNIVVFVFKVVQPMHQKFKKYLFQLKISSFDFI